MNIHWTFSDAKRLSDFADDWDRLNRDGQNLPFLETKFLLPLLQEFSSSVELLAVARADAAPVAALLLRRVGLGRWESSQPSQLPLGPVLAQAGIKLAELSDSLLQALPGLNLSLALTQLDPAYFERRPDAARHSTLDYVATAWVNIEGDFDSYWAGRGKNLRQNLRKQRNKLAADGAELRLEELRDVGSVAPALIEYGGLEAASWKAGLGTAIEADNAQGRFYRNMLEAFADDRRAAIYRYTLNDRVIAMDLCIEADGVLVILKTSYDGSDKSISPAFLMREEQFRRLFEAGRLRRIEFFGKIMEWHTRWSDNSRTLFHCNSYRHALLPQLLALRQRLRGARILAAPAAAD